MMGLNHSDGNQRLADEDINTLNAKDSKIGSFVGTIENKKIKAKYVYQQEGVYAAENIEIVLTDSIAVLNGISIPRITCPEY
jgi:hypothetical protein